MPFVLYLANASAQTGSWADKPAQRGRFGISDPPRDLVDHAAAMNAKDVEQYEQYA
jgi:hypothetical protein